jgi:hypothetical protein
MQEKNGLELIHPRGFGNRIRLPEPFCRLMIIMDSSGGYEAQEMLSYPISSSSRTDVFPPSQTAWMKQKR